MRQELNPQVSCPNQGLLDQESLNLTCIPRFENAKFLPTIRPDGVAVTDADTESAKDGAEEFVVGQHDRIDENVVTQLNCEEFVGAVADIEHVTVLVLNQNGRSGLALGVCFQNGSGAIEGGVVGALLARFAGIFAAEAWTHRGCIRLAWR